MDLDLIGLFRPRLASFNRGSLACIPRETLHPSTSGRRGPRRYFHSAAPVDRSWIKIRKFRIVWSSVKNKYSKLMRERETERLITF